MVRASQVGSHIDNASTRAQSSVGGVASRIGVSVDNPLATLEGTSRSVPAQVQRVEEAMYTPNVESILEALTGPLEVVHNVSPMEVRGALSKWQAAAETEVQSLEDMGAIKRLRGPEARGVLREGEVELIPAKAVWTVKPGSPYKRKCRIVSCGNYASTTEEALLYAGGAGAESLRSLLVHAARRGRRCFGTDIKAAFLLAPIPAHVRKRYAVRPPKILIDLNIVSPEEIWLVQRALYGFRESPRWWAIHRDQVLSTAEWSTPHGRVRLQQFTSESNIWAILTESGECLGHLLIYVDDLLLVTDEEIAEAFVDWIRQRWECTDLQVATGDKPLRFLGVDIFEEVDDYGTIGFSLSQESYIAELLRGHDLRPNSRATTPTPKEWVREAPPAEDFSEDQLRAAQKVTGELLWISQRTRLDTAYSVGLMASWVSRAPTFVVKLGTRVLEYLDTTREERLRLIPGKPDGIRIYTDASFAPHSEHSITGVVLQYDECCVVWKSKKQSLVTLSTAESELVAACEGVVLSQSLEALVAELEGSAGVKRLLVDNTAAVTLAEGGGSQRTRHLRVRAGFIKDMQGRDEIVVEHCPGDVQLADMLTKALPKPRHEMLGRLLGFTFKEALVPSQPPEAIRTAQVPTEPHQQVFAEPRQQGEIDPRLRGVGLWLIGVLLYSQVGQSRGTQSSEAYSESELPDPVSLELSLMMLMMILSTLFLWETARHCVRECCSRRNGGVHEVRMVREDGDEVATRRQRRQDAVRRAIEQEVQGRGSKA